MRGLSGRSGQTRLSSGGKIDVYYAILRGSRAARVWAPKNYKCSRTSAKCLHIVVMKHNNGFTPPLMMVIQADVGTGQWAVSISCMNWEQMKRHYNHTSLIAIST
jgi:hypothetical protein